MSKDQSTWAKLIRFRAVDTSGSVASIVVSVAAIASFEPVAVDDPCSDKFGARMRMFGGMVHLVHDDDVERIEAALAPYVASN